MTWQQYPKGISIETRFGPISLSITEADHIYAATENDTRWTVNGGSVYGISAHLYARDGGFKIGITDSWDDRYHSLYGHRDLGRVTFRDGITEKQREVITTELELAITGWAYANPEILTAAQRAHVNNECDALDEKIARLEQEIASLRARREELIASIS